MNIKIVSDSSSNVYALEGVNYSTVPMKIIAGDKGFVDTPALSLEEMVTYLKQYKGKSGSSCANAQDFKKAVLERYPNANFVIEHTTGLCSFYAEKGGLMIGFEGAYNTNNNNYDF